MVHGGGLACELRRSSDAGQSNRMGITGPPRCFRPAFATLK